VITRTTGFVAGAALALGLAIGLAGTALAVNPIGGHEFMGGQGMMGGGRSPAPGSTYDAGMMGGANRNSVPQPEAVGFVAGTAASPRVIHVIAGPGYAFSPSSITVRRGETVTFAVTTMGPLGHEFMVGPADAVAADQTSVPEVADIRMMQTKSVTYTFDRSGPYAYACHATGHYEAGMHGTITVVA
jgi:plastocyanin